MTLCAHLQMATSPRLSFDNELSPQGASAATLCLVLHRQWPDLFTIIPSSRKFAECLYCDVSPPPILPVLSRSIESPLTYSIYSHTNYIHTFIHPYINTFMYSHIQAYTTHTYIHNINSHMIASVAQSLVRSYPFSSVLKLFQVVSPKQWTTWVYVIVFISSG